MGRPGELTAGGGAKSREKFIINSRVALAPSQARGPWSRNGTGVWGHTTATCKGAAAVRGAASAREPHDARNNPVTWMSKHTPPTSQHPRPSILRVVWVMYGGEGGGPYKVSRTRMNGGYK